MPICPQCYAELGWYIVVCPHCGSNVQPSKEDEPADESITGSESWTIGLAVAFAVGLAVAVVATILKIDRFLVLLLFWASVLVALAAGYAAWAWIRHRKEKKGRR